MNPRRQPGFGLTDGEQLERIWSYLRLFAKITKEQTPNHRIDLLTLALMHYAQRKTLNIGKSGICHIFICCSKWAIMASKYINTMQITFYLIHN